MEPLLKLMAAAACAIALPCFASELSDRVNQTVRLGESFGVWVDADIALNQEPTLNYPVFSQTFKTF